MYDAIYDTFITSAPEAAVIKARADLVSLEVRLNETQTAKVKLETL